MGGELIGPGRYRLKGTGFVVDDNGALADEQGCPGCGTVRDGQGRITGGDYRWLVRVMDPFRKPGAKQVWTYCRVCVSEEQLAAFKAFQKARQPQQPANSRHAKPKHEAAGRRLIE